MKKFIPFESGALETVETVMVRDPLILSPLMRAREALARLRQVSTNVNSVLFLTSFL